MSYEILAALKGIAGEHRADRLDFVENLYVSMKLLGCL